MINPDFCGHKIMQKRFEQLLKRLLLVLLRFDFSINGGKNRSNFLLNRERGKREKCLPVEPSIFPAKFILIGSTFK